MDKQINKFFTCPINNTISQCLNERVLSSTFLGQNGSAIYKWKNAGILNDYKLSKGAMQKYSFIDTMWVNTIELLKSFGLSSTQIKKVKEQLLIKDDLGRYAYFESHLIKSIYYGKFHFIIIDKNIKVSVLDKESYEHQLSQEKYTIGIVINFKLLYDKFIEKLNNSGKSFGELFSLCQMELDFLSFFKRGDFKSIEILNKNGLSEIYKDAKVKSRIAIAEIIRESRYQSITIVRKDGSTSILCRVEKQSNN